MAKNTKPALGTEKQPEKVRRPQHTDFMQAGKEFPDPTPVAPPLGYVKQDSLAKKMREMIMSEQLKAAAREAGVETFEEADDFNVGDDYDPTSPWEEEFDPPMAPEPAPTREDFIADMAEAFKRATSVPLPEQETPPEEPKGGGTPPQPAAPAAPPSLNPFAFRR